MLTIIGMHRFVYTESITETVKYTIKKPNNPANYEQSKRNNIIIKMDEYLTIWQRIPNYIYYSGFVWCNGTSEISWRKGNCHVNLIGAYRSSHLPVYFCLQGSSIG